MKKLNRKELIKKRVRSKIFGSSDRPRLAIKITNRNVIGQLIDDQAGRTLVYSATTGLKAMQHKSLSQKAQWVGEDIAAKAKLAKINKAVLDRGTKIYHGRIKVLAEAARSKGLKI